MRDKVKNVQTKELFQEKGVVEKRKSKKHRKALALALTASMVIPMVTTVYAVSLDQAKQIALKAAGVTDPNSVTYYKQDLEGGLYIIEFSTGQIRYRFEIRPGDGCIMRYYYRSEYKDFIVQLPDGFTLPDQSQTGTTEANTTEPVTTTPSMTTTVSDTTQWATTTATGTTNPNITTKPANTTNQYTTTVTGTTNSNTTRPADTTNQYTTTATGTTNSNTTKPAGTTNQYTTTATGTTNPNTTTESGQTRETTTGSAGNTEQATTTTSGSIGQTTTSSSGNTEPTTTSSAGNTEPTTTSSAGNTEPTTTSPAGNTEPTTTSSAGNTEQATTTPSGNAQQTTTPSGGGQGTTTMQEITGHEIITTTAGMLLNGVSLEEAKTIAFNRAGVQASSVSYLTTATSYYNYLPVYKITFRSGAYDYEYYVRISNGKIVAKKRTSSGLSGITIPIGGNNHATQATTANNSVIVPTTGTNSTRPTVVITLPTTGNNATQATTANNATQATTVNNATQATTVNNGGQQTTNNNTSTTNPNTNTGTLLYPTFDANGNLILQPSPDFDFGKVSIQDIFTTVNEYILHYYHGSNGNSVTIDPKLSSVDENTEGSTSSNGIISLDQAKTIALSKTNRTETEVFNWKASYKASKGYYKIGFGDGTYQYELSIAASNGSVLEYEAELVQ